MGLFTTTEYDIQKWKDRRKVKKLAYEITNQNEKIREKAANALIELHDNRAVDILIEAIHVKNPEIKMKAIEVLGYLGDYRAIKPLIGIYKQSNIWVSRKIIFALGQLNHKDTIEILITTSHHSDTEMSGYAISALTNLGDFHAFKPFYKLLLDKSHFSCIRAIEALAKTNDQRAIIPLTLALLLGENDKYSPTYDIGEKAAKALAHLGVGYWISIFKGDSEDFIRFAEDEDNYALELFFKTLESDPNCKTEIVNWLSKLSLEFWEAIQNKNEDELKKFGESNNSSAKNIFIRALGSERGKIRLYAANILGKMGIDLWKSIILDESSDFIRLGETKNILAYEPLLEALNSSNSVIRSDVAKALGILGDKRAVEPLINALSDNVESGRWCLAEALGILGDKRAVEPLINALNDNNEIVRSCAAEALGILGDKRAVEPLIDKLNDSSNHVKISTTNSLVKLGDRRAIQPLYNLKSSDWYTRWNVACALISFGENQKVIPLLIPLMKNWQNKSQTCLTLIRNFDWTPHSASENVYWNIASKDGNKLREIWEDVKTVLLRDIKSDDYDTIQYALFSFISIGKEEIIPILIDTLNKNGTKTTAEAYLNCGSLDLSNAAIYWAKKHGYTITHSGGSAPVSWGSW